MIILALESSAKAASVALCQDETPLALAFQNSGLTHSSTLLPMVDSLLHNSGMPLDKVELLAVACGPGSFTGLRIGISTVKGLAWGLEKPCAGVSTLEAMAWNLAHVKGVIACAMDARRSQLYWGLFRSNGEKLLRLKADRPVSAAQAVKELAETGISDKIIVGDGAILCYNEAEKTGVPVRLAPPHLRQQLAWGVARAALEQANRGELTDAQGLEASYLRLSQAERERLARESADMK